VLALGIERPVGPEGQESLTPARAVLRERDLGAMFSVRYYYYYNNILQPRTKPQRREGTKDTQEIRSDLQFCHPCAPPAAAPGSRGAALCAARVSAALVARRSWSGPFEFAVMSSGRAGYPGKRSYKGAGSRSGLISGGACVRIGRFFGRQLRVRKPETDKRTNRNYLNKSISTGRPTLMKNLANA